MLPGDEGWDEARSCWNLSVDQRPAGVVAATGPEDVQAAVQFAARAGLRIAPQSTGHGSEVLGALEGSLLLKTSRMRGVSVDPDAGLARVDAGARAGEVGRGRRARSRPGARALADGWRDRPCAGRRHRLAEPDAWARGEQCQRARRRARIRRAPSRGRRQRAGLFCALRGGGGRSAIATSLELRAHQLSELYGGMLVWPAARAGDVLALFRELTLDAPAALSLVFRFIAVPDVEGPPPPLRGRKIVAVIAVNVGGEPDCVAQLRALGGTLADTFKPIEPAELVRVAGDPEDPAPARGGGFMLDTITDETVERLAHSIASDALSSLTILELRHLGGALASPPHRHGAARVAVRRNRIWPGPKGVPGSSPGRARQPESEGRSGSPCLRLLRGAPFLRPASRTIALRPGPSDDSPWDPSDQRWGATAGEPGK